LIVEANIAVIPSGPYPSDDNPLLGETTALLEACGLDDPMQKIYVTTQPLEGLPVLLLLFLLAYLPKVRYTLASMG
jgi:WASH complex subunit strumpellin